MEDVVIDSANRKVVVKGKNADPLKALQTLQKKYSRNVELISPKLKPEDKNKKKEPEKKQEVYYNCTKFTLSKTYYSSPFVNRLCVLSLLFLLFFIQVQVKVVVLKMYMHCEGCANHIKKCIERMKGK